MRILVVDDDPDFRSLAVRAMRREFERAEIVEAGDRASLDRALAASPLPELLVSDLNLNWIDGFGVLESVRAASPHCVAVMFTGTGNEEVAVRAIKAGFDDYVVKSASQLKRLAAAARAAVTRAQARRGLEENRDLLTQELYHRLHNNLQLVVGLIAFTARSIAEPEARGKLENLGRRVQSLSLLQERLYRGGDFRRVEFGAFLRQLVDDLLGLDRRTVETVVKVEGPPLPVDLAVPLALIANELVTNALKHAFPTGQAGQLTISFRGIDDGKYVLEVADNGVGVVPAANDKAPTGLGMRLVHRLAQQVGSTVRIEGTEGGGRRCRIEVQAPPATAA